MWEKKRERLQKNIQKRLKRINEIKEGIAELNDQLKFLRSGEDNNLVVIMECEIKVAETKLKEENRFVSYLRNFISK